MIAGQFELSTGGGRKPALRPEPQSLVSGSPDHQSTALGKRMGSERAPCLVIPGVGRKRQNNIRSKRPRSLM
jgi:hypothetical protein